MALDAMAKIVLNKYAEKDLRCSAWRTEILHDLEGWAKYLEKTAHFFMLPFKKKILKTINVSAKLYSGLCDNFYIVSSADFQKAPYYVLHFYPQNFLHLTGVKTSLTPLDFFLKAKNGELLGEDFDCGSPKSANKRERDLYGHVVQKMRHLPKLAAAFNGEEKLCAQENFKKGAIPCCFATANGKFTIGFIGKELCPLTLLNGNMLDLESLANNVKIEIIKIRK